MIVPDPITDPTTMPPMAPPDSSLEDAAALELVGGSSAAAEDEKLEDGKELELDMSDETVELAEAVELDE